MVKMTNLINKIQSSKGGTDKLFNLKLVNK